MKFQLKKHLVPSALWILGFAVLDSSPLYAATVSGAITGAANWSLANSPYIVTANLTVNNGAALSIEPGVKVELAVGVNFTVANGGRVLADGNETNSIVFTR
ncbi:MAG: hypothetical protein JWM99_4768, partial [Verrucomicrobiales bacterium]|nr:hypothetical protein [Verrucomicrobiales bacterium]